MITIIIFFFLGKVFFNFFIILSENENLFFEKVFFRLYFFTLGGFLLVLEFREAFENRRNG
jgi:hypothetical protein